jgi:hypothetical protein
MRENLRVSNIKWGFPCIKSKMRGVGQDVGIKNTTFRFQKYFGVLSFYMDIKMNNGTNWSHTETKSSNYTHTSAISIHYYKLITLKLTSGAKFVILSQLP